MSMLGRATFFRGGSAPRDGVACRTASLFWLVAASRYERRRPRTGETLPGGAVVAQARVRRDGRDEGRGRGGGGGKGAMLEQVICSFGGEC